MFRILSFCFLMVSSLISFSQSYWKIENEHHDEILLTVDLNRAKGTFEAFTRKDALKDIAGTFTYTLAKAAGKLKYPEIVFIEGKTHNSKDSLLLTGTFYYFDKQYPFSASITGNRFAGKYMDTKNKPHPLTGIKLPDNRPLKDYPSIINSAFLTTEKYLLKASWLKSGEWLSFREKMNELKPKISDDYELAASFFWLGKKLPFSPYEISKSDLSDDSPVRKNQVSIRELKPSAALLEANMLPVTRHQVDSIASIIDQKGFTRLIIDLRGNFRQNPFAANELVSYISSKAIDAGVYLTRKWFETNRILPASGVCETLPKGFPDGNYANGDLCKIAGSCLRIVPRSKTFRGKVYVLTDSKTSKVFEALIRALKNDKIATIVGQKTAGFSMLAEKIKVNKEYELVLPVADFYTCDGKNLEQTGVDPDIAVSGEDAMKYILKSL